jgi:hypothetical protein
MRVVKGVRIASLYREGHCDGTGAMGERRRISIGGCGGRGGVGGGVVVVVGGGSSSTSSRGIERTRKIVGKG